jgi:uncharacterized protein YkwD
LFPIILVLTFLTACRPGIEGLDSDWSSGPGSNANVTAAVVDLDAAILTGAESILNAINVQRAEAGVSALVSQPTLVDLAFMRSTDMSVRSYTGHADPSSGENLPEIKLSEMGYAGPAAELVYATRDPLESVAGRVVEAWFDDPMHKALLLEPSFRYCGIGMMGDGEWWKIALILTVDIPEEASQ